MPGKQYVLTSLAYQIKPFQMWRWKQGEKIMDRLTISHRQKKKDRKRAIE